MLFRKSTFHPNYDPTYAGFQTSTDPMRIIGLFELRNGETTENKAVVISTNGVEKNDLPRKEEHPIDYCYFMNADHDSERRKFQLHAEMKDTFVSLAEVTYDYKIEMGREVPDLYGRGESFFCDFCILKENGVKVHFKMMSDGERKIAKIISGLCNPIYMNSIDIVLIDNIELHVYMARHAKMLRTILKTFPKKQFIATTHSPILVGVDDEENNIHIPGFVKPEFRYNVDKYKEEEVQRLGKVKYEDKPFVENNQEDIERLVKLSNEIDLAEDEKDVEIGAN
jgi:predicted ATPase